MATTFMWLGAPPPHSESKITLDGSGHVTFGVNKCHSDLYWVPVVHVVGGIYPEASEIELLVPLHLDPNYTYALHGRTNQRRDTS